MTYQASSSGSVNLATAHTTAVPSGLADGHYVVLLLRSDNGYPYVSAVDGWPAGFAELSAEASTGGPSGRVRKIRGAWKYITSAASEGSGGNYTVNIDYGEGCWLEALSFAGRANSAPLVSPTNDGVAAASPISVALTGVTALAGDDLLFISNVAADTDNTTSSSTAPSGFTSRQSMNAVWRISNTSTKNGVAAGATGTITGQTTFNAAADSQYAGLVIAIPAGSSTPTLSAGTPTGSGGANRTVGATTDKITGTARIVIDTSANLDTASIAQVAAGDREGDVNAAYDSGDITVSGTSFTHDFTGIAPGTWMAAATHDGAAVLRWSFTVAAQNPGVKTPALQINGVNVGAKTNVEYWVLNSAGTTVLAHGTTGTIDSSSVFTLDSDVVGSVGADVNLMLYYGTSGDNNSVVAKTTVIDLDA